MTKRIDFDGRAYSAHAQDHWLEFTGNPNYPDYLRITFVAYARHAANGHARLDRGELAQYLVRKDGTLPDRRSVWTSIQTAIKLGYLLPDSQQLCLVVSSEHVQGGKGEPDLRCPRDHTRRPKPAAAIVHDLNGRITKVGDDDRHSESNVGGDARRSTTNVGGGHRRSTPEPSSSSQHGPSGPDAVHPRRTA